MSRIAVFFADGFEEIEALTVVDICRRAGIAVEMVSVKEEKEVTGSHGICVKTDVLFDEVDFESLDMLVLPGGMPGTRNLEKHQGLMAQLDSFYAAGRYVAAICAAPTVMGHRGILKGRKACCYPGMRHRKSFLCAGFRMVCSCQDFPFILQVMTIPLQSPGCTAVPQI